MFVYVCCRFVVVNVYAGTINRRIRLVFVAYTVGIGLRYCIEYFTKCVAYIPRMVGVHSVRRRGRFISPVYVCCCFVVDYSLCSCMFVSFSG